MAELSPRESLIVAGVMQGKSDVQAGIDAGLSPRYARKSMSKILRRPHVAAAIKEAQEKLKAASQMTAEKLLAQLQEDRECAKTWKQGTAMVRASEMIGRLTGLLVEKVEVKHELPSIIDAIEAGLARAGLPPHVTQAPPLIDITPTPAPAVADPFSD